ncbi:hypothetical protein QTO34_003121 [Cnephaeus nilssonii]|uniref:Uncharacterized protein n=1 Tax=Cnephaeus nilssonii TaxID=3371016 RepID=A0AA40HQ64_CNENI|nr:hypothetical protein QTO34_003121 [Eptesicus nilssonii]
MPGGGPCQFSRVLLCGVSALPGVSAHTRWNQSWQILVHGSLFPIFLCKLFSIFLKIYLIDFLQRGRERDRKPETSMREKHRSAASCTPPTGDVPATNIRALDRNRTWDPPVRRPTLYPLSQTCLGQLFGILTELFSVLRVFSEVSPKRVLAGATWVLAVCSLGSRGHWGARDSRASAARSAVSSVVRVHLHV